MAANITIGSCAVAADGKTITATIAGGTGTGYAISTVAGLTPHVSPGANFYQSGFGLTVASASVSGSTLTVVCQTPLGTGETAQFDIATSATLTDSGANTPTGQTNLAITNNSTVVVVSVDLKTQSSKFETSALAQVGLGWNSSGLTTNIDNWFVEFVSDATEVAAYTYSGSTTTFRKDTDTATSTASALSGFWCAKALTSGTPLAAGKHLWRLSPGQYFFGVRLSNSGTATMSSIATTKNTLLANTAGLIGIPASTNVKAYGAYNVQSAANGTVNSNGYVGMELDVGFTGTGIEVLSLASTSGAWAASIDGGQPGALVGAGTAAVNNQTDWLTLAKGLTPGAHTLKTVLVGMGGNTNSYMIRVVNGTTLTAAPAISDTSIQVNDVTYISVNDWVKIGSFEKREWRQVTAVSGSAGAYVLTVAALTNAHSIGDMVTSYAALAGSLSAFTPNSFTKRVAAFGDSNTQGANQYGPLGTNTPDGFGNFYGAYDPRCDPINLVCAAASATWPPPQQLGYEVVNLGIQGQSTAQIVARVTDAASSSYGRAGFDYITLWPGTNDINSLTTTAAAYQTSLQTFVTNAATYLNAGGKIVLIAPNTPQGVTNAGGLNIAACRAACAAIAAANPSNTIYALNASFNLTQANDIIGGGSGLHLTATGQTKVAQNLLAYLGVGLNEQSMMLCAA